MTAERASAAEYIVLADDGSEAVRSAMPTAQVLASQLGLGVTLLHVRTAAAPPPASLVEHAREIRGDHSVRVGDAAEELVRVAGDPTTALLILTTHGRGRESEGRLGHITEQVVARTNHPVLLVRPEASSLTRPEPLRRLLVPIDGARDTARSLQAVFTLACRLRAAIEVLAVVPGDAKVVEPGGTRVPLYIDQPQHEWGGWENETLRRLAADIPALAPSTPITIHVARGPVGETIIRCAQQHAADAIVLVRRSRLQPGRARVLRLLLARTPLPILIVGARSRDAA